MTNQTRQEMLYAYIAYLASTLQSVIKHADYVRIIDILEQLNPEHIVVSKPKDINTHDLVSIASTMQDAADMTHDMLYLDLTTRLYQWTRGFVKNNGNITDLYDPDSIQNLITVNHKTIVNDILKEIKHLNSNWTLIPNDFLFTIYVNRMNIRGIIPLGQYTFLNLLTSLLDYYPEWTRKFNCAISRRKTMPEPDPIIKHFNMQDWMDAHKDIKVFRGLVENKEEERIDTNVEPFVDQL